METLATQATMKIAFHATLILQVNSKKSRDSIGTTIRQLRAPHLKQFY